MSPTDHWSRATLADLGHEVRQSLRPEPGILYELFSVPAFPAGRPEILDGNYIGSAKRIVRPEDVLICKINPRINRVWTVPEPLQVGQQIASSEYLVFRPEQEIESRFLMWYLRSPSFRDWIELSVEGATGSHTRAKSDPILRQLVPVPPLEEQHRIVAAIEEQFSRLDAGESAIESGRRRLRVFRSAERDAAVQSGWPRELLSDVADLVTGSTPSTQVPEYWGTGLPFITPGDFNHGQRVGAVRRQLTPPGAAKARPLPANSVLLTCIGATIGKAALAEVKCVTNQQITALVPRDRTMRPDYLFHVVCSDSFQRAVYSNASSTTMPILNKSRLARLMTPVPPLRDQQAIAERLDAALAIADALENELGEARRQAAALRKSILRDAFNGRLAGETTAALAHGHSP